MALNQKQRDYFIDRVNRLTDQKLAEKKARHASEIQKIADEKYREFLESLGIEDDMDNLNQVEKDWKVLKLKLEGVMEALNDVNPPDLKFNNNFYSNKDVHSTFKNHLTRTCRHIAKNEFYKTEAGRDIKVMEDTKTRAIDTIMMDGSKAQDLSLKLNGILAECGIQLLEPKGA